MGVLDIVLSVLILFGLVRGFMKGFFVEIASLLALVAGVYGAMHFSNYAADFLSTKVEWDIKTINITAFAITFIVIVLIISLVGRALTKLASFAALGIVNKILGGLFGGLKTAFILSVLLIIFDRMNSKIPFANDKELEDSAFYEPVKSLVPMVFPSIIHAVEDKSRSENEPLKI